MVAPPVVDDPSDYALMIFGPRNPIRRLFIGICTFEVPNTSFSFDNLIILLIIFSCGTMAMESCMVVEGGTLAHFLEQSNLYATYVFLFEMVAKVCRDSRAAK